MSAPLDEALHEQPPQDLATRFRSREYSDEALVRIADVVGYNKVSQLSHLKLADQEKMAIVLDETRLVIWIAGARESQTSNKGSWSVYFGEGSQYSVNGCIDTDGHSGNWFQTLEALSQATTIIRTLAASHDKIRQVTVASFAMGILKALMGESDQWSTYVKTAREDLLDLKRTHGIAVSFWILYHGKSAQGQAAQALAAHALTSGES